jgi:hypothetical protein
VVLATRADDPQFPSRETLITTLLSHVPKAKQDVLCDFLIRLYAVYVDLHCKSCEPAKVFYG